MISKPDVTIAIIPETGVVGISPRKDLIICSVPGVAANVLVTGVQAYTKTALDTLLGASTYSRFLVQAWLDANQTGTQKRSELDVITLKPSGTDVAATLIHTLAGTATEAGSLTISVASSKDFSKTVAVPNATTAAEVATLIETAYASTVMPVTLVKASAVLTFTSNDPGAIGNALGTTISGLPAGITDALTQTAGTGVPVVTDVMDLVGDIRYQGILWPSDLTATTSEVADFLDTRFNSSNDILDGVAFMGMTDTLANLLVAANAENSQSFVMMGNAVTVADATKLGPEIPHPVDWCVAEFMAIRARRLTLSASLGSVITTTATNDQYGGRPLASLPYFNTPLAGIPVVQSVALFNGTEQAELNDAGFSVFGPNRSYTGTVMGAVVTTYKRDAAGNPNESFKYLNYVDTASVCREYIFEQLKATFAQSRLTDGDLKEGKSIENADSLKAAMKGYFNTLKHDALIRDGRAAAAIIENSLEVVLDLRARTAAIVSELPIVTQLEIINASLQLSFEL